MAEHQKIHPIHDPEAPLVPNGIPKSDQLPADTYPPFKRSIPPSHSKPPKRRSCFCKCCCWTISLILLLIVIIGVTIGIIFLVFKPKLPNYSIDKLQINQFNLSDDGSLSATFDVTITATNPNEKIGIYYEKGSHVSVWYNSSQLCNGALPKFYQGHRNTTVLLLVMNGRTENANGLLVSLQAEQTATGVVPLKLKVDQPVRIRLGKLKLMKVKFLARCHLDVDSLAANNVISIKNSKCSYKLRL